MTLLFTFYVTTLEHLVVKLTRFWTHGISGILDVFILLHVYPIQIPIMQIQWDTCPKENE